VSPVAIAAIVLVCVFGGALCGMLLRTVLPEHHLSDASKNTVSLMMGPIATLSALVLGLLVASAKSSFDTANDGFRQSAAKLILLDRTLAHYGPETKELREAIRKSTADRLAQLFPKDGASRATLSSPQGTAANEGVQQRLRALSPENDAQRRMQSRALDLVEAIAQARWQAIEEEDNRTPTPFLFVLVFWLALMFVSFGLFAPRNPIATAVLVMGAISLATAIFLIEELYDPLGGAITISNAPMYKALSLLGQ
jgi:hypothetical protein